MNFPATLPRNHFHPAWLLLPVPPLVAFVCDGLADTGPLRFALFLRLASAALLLGTMLWLQGNALPGTGERLLK